MSNHIAEAFYLKHYNDVIGPSLTTHQKQELAKEISETTMQNPIWIDKHTDHAPDFPQLKPHINTTLSGLYLCTILKGIISDLNQGI